MMRLVIDGHAVAYRAFYANPGECLSIFKNMILDAANNVEAAYWACAWEGARSIEARRLLLPTYKAGRTERPLELESALPQMRRLCGEMGMDVVAEDGMEADDVIGGMASQSMRTGDPLMILTSDKDLCQLVTEHIRIVSPKHEYEELGPDAVFAKHGVWPHQIVDWIALMGDSSDSIPGIAGVGPTTAAAMLAWGETLEGIYERQAEWPDRGIKPKVRMALDAGREAAFLYRRVAQLQPCVPTFVWRERA